MCHANPSPSHTHTHTDRLSVSLGHIRLPAITCTQTHIQRGAVFLTCSSSCCSSVFALRCLHLRRGLQMTFCCQNNDQLRAHLPSFSLGSFPGFVLIRFFLYSWAWCDTKTYVWFHTFRLYIQTCVSVLTVNSVVEVLEKHGLQKPISYVKDSQNSEEEAHQLMVKLCRHTGRKYALTHIHNVTKSGTLCATFCLLMVCF